MNRLEKWVKEAPSGYVEKLAELADTSPAYVRMLARGHRVNPKLKLALGISKGIASLNDTIAREHNKGMPCVSVEDLNDIAPYNSVQNL